MRKSNNNIENERVRERERRRGWEKWLKKETKVIDRSFKLTLQHIKCVYIFLPVSLSLHIQESALFIHLCARIHMASLINVSRISIFHFSLKSYNFIRIYICNSKMFAINFSYRNFNGLYSIL